MQAGPVVHKIKEVIPCIFQFTVPLSNRQTERVFFHKNTLLSNFHGLHYCYQRNLTRGFCMQGVNSFILCLLNITPKLFSQQECPEFIPPRIPSSLTFSQTIIDNTACYIITDGNSHLHLVLAMQNKFIL